MPPRELMVKRGHGNAQQPFFSMAGNLSHVQGHVTYGIDEARLPGCFFVSPEDGEVTNSSSAVSRKAHFHGLFDADEQRGKDNP